MTPRLTVTDRVFHALSRTPECQLEDLLEELVSNCDDLTWNQVFLEIDRLNRTGQVLLTLNGPGRYRIRLAHPR